jgi:hypothetical protein
VDLVKQAIVAQLAKELGINPMYIQLEDPARLRSRQRRRLLTSTGLDMKIVLLADNGGALANELKELTSSASFWDEVKQKLAGQGVSLNTTDVNVETGTKCNGGFVPNNETGGCDAVPFDCPRGTYKKAGTHACSFCESGKYSNTEGAFACQSCVSNSNSSAKASTLQDCLCDPGYYMELVNLDETPIPEDEQVCRPCPENSNCGISGHNQHSLVPALGYWRATNTSSVFHQCPLVIACPGQGFNNSRNAQCKFGHFGVRCELCDEEEGFVIRPDGTCEQCDAKKRRTTMILFVVIPLVIITSAWLFIRWMGWKHNEVLGILRDIFERRASKFRILIGFTQIVSRITVTFRLSFPRVVVDLLRLLNVFEFLNIFKFVFIPNCLYSMGYYDQLICEVLVPAIILVLAMAGYRISGKAWMYELFLLLSFVCYPAFCESLYGFFDCQEYEDGQEYLVINPSVKCTDDKYLTYKPFVGIMAFVIPFGIVVVYFIELYRHRNTLYLNRVRSPESRHVTDADLQMISRQWLAEEQQPTAPTAHSAKALAKTVLKRSGERGITRAQLTELFEERARATGLSSAQEWLRIVVRDARCDVDKTHHVKFLYEAYRPQYFWFEAFDMLRKFLLTGLPLLTRLASPDSNTEAVWGTVLMSIFLFGIGLMDPYIKKSDQYLALPAHLQLVITMVAGMGEASMENDSDTGIFVAVLVLFPASVIIVTLVYMIIDPELEMWPAKKVVEKWNAFQEGAQNRAAKKLKPVLERWLQRVGLEWADVEPFVEKVDSVEEIQEAIEDPGALWDRWLATELQAETRERLYMRLRLRLEPEVLARGLAWADIEAPIRAEFEDIKTLQDWVDLTDTVFVDSVAFLERVSRAGGPAAKKLAIVHLKPRLEPYLQAQGLVWADVVPVLEAIDSIEELRAALEYPEGLLERVSRASGPAAKKLAIVHLKPRLDPYLQAQGLEWADVVPVLEAIDSIEELRAAVEYPEGLLERVSRASGPAAKKLAIMHLKPRLEPHLHAQGVEWADVVPVLEAIDSIEELKAAAEDPEALFERILGVLEKEQSVENIHHKKTGEHGAGRQPLPSLDTRQTLMIQDREANNIELDCVLGQIQQNITAAEQNLFDLEELEEQAEAEIDRSDAHYEETAAAADPVSLDQLNKRLCRESSCVPPDFRY